PTASGRHDCDGTFNSTSDRGFLTLYGDQATTTAKVLAASALPAGTFALLLVGTDPAVVPSPGGSEGVLCLGGTIGRYNSSIASPDAAGTVDFSVDPAALPIGIGSVAATAGSTFQWQVWHRDVTSSGAVTSNFTNSVALRFE
ncbi:MAG: hypothetical protein AAFQ17_05740, partial [Pseudomonadota bacterium]